MLLAFFLLALSPEARAQGTTVQRLGTASLSAQPGQTVTLAMRFNAAPMAEDYGVFVHFIDSAGANHAPSGADHAPPVPTSRWSGAIAYNHTVTLPASMPRGTYAIRVGLYQTHSPWGRVALTMGTGVTVDDQLRYNVGTLNVAPATSEILQLATPSLSAQPGQSVTLGMRWNAVPQGQDYYVFVHFVDANGVQQALSGDHLPPVSTATWSGAVSYNRTVTVPTNFPAGQYTIRAGLYPMSAPNSRVTLRPGPGVTADNETRYIIGTLTVGQPQTTTQVLQLANPSLSAQPGQTVTLGMRWNAVPMSQNYYVFVHFVDANGVQQALSGDHLPPVDTSVWSGAISYDRSVTVPTNFATGQYTIRVGLYPMSAPNNRVPLTPGPGVTADNETRYIVGTLNVSGGGTPSSGGPVGQDANAYVLTFSEEFNSGFDTGKWNDHIWYDASNPTINYAVKNGVLKIWPQRDASGSFFNRTLDTDGKFQQQYGYFEMEAKLPVGKGVWPAFWLFAHPGDRRPEIDIMEAYPGGGPNSGWGDANLHPVAFAATVWPNGASNPSAGHKTLQTVDLSAGFHTYAVKWEAGRQTFYFDGQPFYTLNVSMADPMYILLDLWFGSASGTPDSSTPTGEGNSFEVNYVRAWQFKTSTSTPGSAAVNYQGRFDTTDSAGPRFTWSNSAIAAQFTGPSLAVTLNNSEDLLYFAYSIDGQPVQRFATSVGTRSYTLATGLSAGTHKVELFRDNEGNLGVTQFLGFNFGGGQLQAPPVYSSNVRLEVIGDSNACGYGALGADPCPFSNATESAYAAYPQQTARILGARPATTLCYSGIGVYRNWGYSGPSADFPAMPTYFQRTLTDSPAQYAFPTDASAQPNVVVIQLGGNDFWDGVGPSQSDFVNAYVGLAREVRSRYPGAHIIAASSPMNSSAKSYIQTAVNQLKASGESKIQFLDMYDAQAFTNMGCNGHPNAETQKRVATQLAGVIQTLAL